MTFLWKRSPQSESEWITSLEKCIRAGVDLLLVCKDIGRACVAVDGLAKIAESDQEFKELLLSLVSKN